MTTETLPLFPLGNPLLPGARVPLQIFEPRYVDLVKRCLRENSEFGVILIREGHEVMQSRQDLTPTLHTVGTRARIVDWDGLPNGRLGITIAGGERFQLHDTHRLADGLVMGSVSPRPGPPGGPIPGHFHALADLLASLLVHPALQRLGIGPVEDALSLAGSLTQWLPIPAGEKQAILELDDPEARLARVDALVREMGG